ncbi:ArnT family glycosyltransferase [Vibrio superstes]|uniref:Phospholipid carrier-dependent glycosyltransferase n=1 Tax=Vibrio superstes NBRC 103154 TaxID=1219062 RepID=A0A511QP80_9VIBR|nr:glycosyltransferase family 39 protein [Vibrio superstes]GEM79143.1 phospholipid carrier-dependent glycosyltransferase [Vibrio superstes NBRC 103154]
MRINRLHLWFLLGAALLIRLLSLAAYPLMDTTEARYGEMARLMFETGNWVTPQFDYGVPFWGKPPLFTWMSTIGIEAFGVNEFAVRFPHWLAGLAVIGLIARFIHKQGFSGLLTAVVLATCGIFSISAGAVMTDMALTLGMTLAMLGFYQCWQGSKAWGYIGFIGLAIGMLAKGPLILVLFGIAVLPWLILQHGLIGAIKELSARFPLVGGTALLFALSLPWYLLAEQATPGFLEYFIVGEHFSRFVVSGWEGDLYGSAHDEVRGAIWWFWLYSAAPWSVVLPLLFCWKQKKGLKHLLKQSPLFSFLLFWLISPMLLFTFAGNILPAYVLPGIPALAGLIAILLDDIDRDALWVKLTAGVVPVLLVAAAMVLQQGIGDERSDKVLLAKTTPKVTTYYVGKRPFSGQFYSAGQAKKLTDWSEIDKLRQVQLIGKQHRLDEIVQSKKLNCIIETNPHNRRSLYKCENNS